MTTPGPGGGGSLGNATGTIVINFNGQGIQAAQNALNQLGNAAQRNSAQVDDAAKGMVAAGALIAGGFLISLKKAAEFEKQLSSVQAVSGATVQEMEQVRQKALQLGSDTAFSAAEGAQAIEELVKAGISMADVMGGAADATVALAAAGEIDLPLAATIASNAMNQFKLAAEELPRVADLLAGSANASAIAVQDVGESLNYVGPVAQAVGVSIDDVNTAIAILGNNGIKGSSAGTALRSVLSNLAPTTKKATEEFKALGLITEEGTNLFIDQATGGIKPLAEVVDILNKKTANLSKTEKNTFAKKSFGLETLSTVAILAGETGESFDAMSASINKIGAADVAATRLDNLYGSVDALKGSFETLMIVVGTPFLNAVRGVVDGVNQMIGVYLELPGPIRDLISIVGVLSGAFLLLAGTLILTLPKIAAFRAGLQALAATSLVQTIVTNFRGLIFLMGGPWVAAIAAATAVIGALFFMNRKGKPSIEDLTEAIKADSDALGENTRLTIANRLQKEGILDAADRLGLNLADVTAATLGDAAAQERLNAALAATKGPIDQQIQDLRKQANSLENVGNQAQLNFELSKLQSSGALKDVNSVTKAYQFQAGEVKRAVAANDQRKRASEQAATAAQTEAAVVENQLNRALGRTAEKARAAAGGSKTLSTDVQKVGAEAAAADTKIKNLNTALKSLFDQAFGTGRALDTFKGKINSLKTQAQDSGTKLTGFSDKAIANREAFRTAAESIGTYANELLEADEAPDVVAAKIDKMRQELIDQAGAAGFSKSEVADLIGVLEEMPDTVTTHLDVNNTAGIAAVQELQGQINSLRGREVYVGVNGSRSTAGGTTAFAEGGIVSKATRAIVGEAGPEAIVPLPDLAQSFLRIYRAGQVSTTTVPHARSGGGSGASGGGSSSARIVSGTLSIDRTGRAYIRGVAEDVVDGNEAFAGTYGRMG